MPIGYGYGGDPRNRWWSSQNTFGSFMQPDATYVAQRSPSSYNYSLAPAHTPGQYNFNRSTPTPQWEAPRPQPLGVGSPQDIPGVELAPMDVGRVQVGAPPSANADLSWVESIGSAAGTIAGIANPILGIGSGILGAIGVAGMFGKRRAAHSAGYYDYDPNNEALGRFKELTNLESSWNRGMFGRFRTLAEDAGPSLDSLLGLSAAQNVSPSIAYARSRAQTAEARESAFRRFQDYTMANEGYSQGYLGQHYGKEQWAAGMAAQDEWGQDAYDREMYNQAAILGGGGLMNWLG